MPASTHSIVAICGVTQLRMMPFEVPRRVNDHCLTTNKGSFAVRKNLKSALVGTLSESEVSPARQGSTNHALEGRAIDAQCHLDDAAAKFLNTAAARLGWSARSIHRCLKVARTIADLVGAQSVQVTHVAEAVQYRRALKTTG